MIETYLDHDAGHTDRLPGVNPEIGMGAIRFCFGRGTIEAEIRDVVERLDRVLGAGVGEQGGRRLTDPGRTAGPGASGGGQPPNQRASRSASKAILAATASRRRARPPGAPRIRPEAAGQ